MSGTVGGMARSRASAKAAGSAFETLMAQYLARTIDDRIERRVTNGAKDRGDISGLRIFGQRVTLECKNYRGQIKAAEWTNEAEIEKGNDDALAGVVFAKRRGTTNPGEQWVLMTASNFVALLTGQRQDEA